MMTTYLVGKHPFIKLGVQLKNRWQMFDCMIDTGFSGGLALPLRYKLGFSETSFIEARFILANSAEVTVDTTYTRVRYNNHEKEVAVVFMGESDSLVGVEFLNAMRFCLDLKKNRAELT